MAQVVFPDTYRPILSQEQIDYMMEMMYSTDSLTRQMTIENQQFLLDEDCGYVSFRYEGLNEEGRDVFHIEKLYVMPEFQGKGLGTQLFHAVIEMVRNASIGSPRIELNVNRNNPAVNFYEHLGMSIARSGDFPIGEGFFMNDYIMSIDL